MSTTTNIPATSDPVRLHPGQHTAAAAVVAQTSPSARTDRAALQELMWADAAALFAQVIDPTHPLPGYTGPEPHTSSS